MVSIKTIVLFATAAAAVVVPRQTDGPITTTTTTSAPATVTKCDYEYCDGTSSWCFYWAGVTGYDVSLGPVPGETRAPLGPCSAPAVTTTTASS